MIYPVEEQFEIKVVDGGYSQMFMDLVPWIFKIFIFIFVGLFATWCWAMVIGDQLERSLTVSCQQEVLNMFDKN